MSISVLSFEPGGGTPASAGALPRLCQAISAVVTSPVVKLLPARQRVYARFLNLLVTTTTDNLNFKDALALPAPPLSLPPNHPHAHAAARRSAARDVMRGWAAKLGLKQYFVSMSQSELTRGEAGSRPLYDVKDMLTYTRFKDPDVIGPRTAIVLTDVVYHLSDVEFATLMDGMRPVFSYHYALNKPVLHSDEATIRYDVDKKKWVFRFADHSEYMHSHPDFSVEGFTTKVMPTWMQCAALGALSGVSLFCARGFWKLLVPLGFAASYLAMTRVTYTQVLRKPMGESREVAMLLPRRQCSALAIVALGLPTSPLRAAQPQVFEFEGSKYAYMRTCTPTGVENTIARHPLNHSETLSDKAVSVLMTRVAESRSNVAAGHATALLKSEGEDVNTSAVDLFLHVMPALAPRVRFTDPIGVPAPALTPVETYRLDDGLEPASRKTLHRFMDPILPAFVPDIASKVNAKAAIAGRLQKPQAATLERDCSHDAEILEVARALITIIYESTGPLEPCDIDRLLENAQTAMKRNQILLGAEYMPIKLEEVTKSFIKREPYDEKKDPRIIQPLEATHRVAWGTFMVPLADALAKQPWYSFKNSPAKIADAVSDICVASDFVITTDMSRFDGTVGKFARGIEEMLLSTMFPAHMNEVRDLHRTSHSLKCRLNGVSFETGYTRASGEAGTSVLNTFLVAVAIAYANYLSGNALSQGMKLAIVGGDDGVAGNIGTAAFDLAASRLGFKAKSVLREQGDTVDFLARIYGPGVWFGDSNSMCSPARTLRQFSLTHRPPTTPVSVVAADKALMLLLTDAETPIIGDLARKVAGAVGHSTLTTAELMNSEDMKWCLKEMEPTGYYPNSEADWMTDVINKEIDVTPAFLTWLHDRDAPWHKPPPLTPAGTLAPAPTPPLAPGKGKSPAEPRKRGTRRKAGRK